MTTQEAGFRLSQDQILALTIWAEARAESLDGQAAVGCVIRNRVLAQAPTRFGTGYIAVCLKPWAFSCWKAEGGKKNYEALMAQCESMLSGSKPPLRVRKAIWLARMVMDDAVEDLVKGATHYYSPKGMVPSGSVPKWAKLPAQLTVVIGDHQFWKGA